MVCGEELERVDLEERRVEEELNGGGPLLRVFLQALPEEVPLLLVLQLVDGRSDLLFRYGTFRREQILIRGTVCTRHKVIPVTPT